VAEKTTKLSIVVRTVDQTTAKLRAITTRIEALKQKLSAKWSAASKPFRDFGSAISDLAEKSGLSTVASGIGSIGGALAGLAAKLAVIGGGLLAAAIAGVMSLIGKFDELGDKAERIGVSVDFLAQMRYAAEKPGAEVENLDTGLQGFSGQPRAGARRHGPDARRSSTRLAPRWRSSSKAAKSNEEAFDLLAAAMTKLKDPAKRAALAQKTLGDAALAPLFARGAEGIKQLARATASSRARRRTRRRRPASSTTR
jgi:hypothetical protein